MMCCRWMLPWPIPFRLISREKGFVFCHQCVRNEFRFRVVSCFCFQEKSSLEINKCIQPRMFLFAPLFMRTTPSGQLYKCLLRPAVICIGSRVVHVPLSIQLPFGKCECYGLDYGCASMMLKIGLFANKIFDFLQENLGLLDLIFLFGIFASLRVYHIEKF